MKNRKGNGMVLASDNWVSKSNALNEVRNNRMTISQIRLFTIYLSKINPKDIESREVTFKLDDYTKIMQFKQTNTTRLIKTAEDLLGLTVKFWDKTGQYSVDGFKGFVMCQLFKRFRLSKNDDDGEWYVTIDCHDDVVKLMFELQKYYFKYQLWNALQLTSTNQQRMYEVLKQYEYVGEAVISIKDLREFLGLNPDEYSRWQNFKIRVLDTSQEALAQYTDIKFTWEVAARKGKGGKITAIRFKVEKNNDYVRQLTLDEYLTEQKTPTYKGDPEEFERPDEPQKERSPYDEKMDLLSDACGNEFSIAEIAVLHDAMLETMPYEIVRDNMRCYEYLNQTYRYMNMRAEKNPIQHRFSYMKSIIGKD